MKKKRKKKERNKKERSKKERSKKEKMKLIIKIKTMGMKWTLTMTMKMATPMLNLWQRWDSQ